MATESGVKVTVGLCVKNSQATVKAAVDSILAQDYPRGLMELVVVDGSSRDQTVEVIKNCLTSAVLQSKFFFENHGLGKARQTVVEQASGAYVVWVDGDMELPADFVRKQVEFMDANPEVGIGKGKYAVDPKARLVASLENMEFLINYNSVGETDLKYLGTSGCIYRVDAIRQAGGFDANFRGVGEDMDAEYRIRSNGWKLHITNAAFIERRRDSWRSLWDEYFWHGFGFRSLLNKNRDMVNIGKVLPPIAVAVELTRVPKAYKLTRQKAAVLLPFHYVFKRIAWFFGFLSSRRQP
jgi:glycosyltransferase involved in cell wall biosynthesis